MVGLLSLLSMMFIISATILYVNIIFGKYVKILYQILSKFTSESTREMHSWRP